LDDQLVNRIKAATGAVEVIPSRLNDYAWELQLLFVPPRSIGDITSALVSLKEVLAAYGLLAKEPKIDTPGDYIVLLVKVYRRNSKPTYTI